MKGLVPYPFEKEASSMVIPLILPSVFIEYDAVPEASRQLSVHIADIANQLFPFTYLLLAKSVPGVDNEL